MPVDPSTLSERFARFRDAVIAAGGESVAADYFERAFYGPGRSRPHASFGQAPRRGGAPHGALLAKEMVLSGAFDRDRPCWFLFSERVYDGDYSQYGPVPPEAPSIWDEPDLLSPDHRNAAEHRDVERIDPYTLNGDVQRQWLLWMKRDDLGYEGVVQAITRFWMGTEDEKGPRTSAQLVIAQPGVPLLFLANPVDAACTLVSRDVDVLRSVAREYSYFLSSFVPQERDPRNDSSVGPPPVEPGDWLELVEGEPSEPDAYDWDQLVDLPAPDAFYERLFRDLAGVDVSRGSQSGQETVPRETRRAWGFRGSEKVGYRWVETKNLETSAIPLASDTETYGLAGMRVRWRFSWGKAGAAGHAAFRNGTLLVIFDDDEARSRFADVWEEVFGSAPRFRPASFPPRGLHWGASGGES